MKAVSILERTPNFRRCVKLKFIKSVKISWETARAVTDHRDHLSPENNLSRLKLRAIKLYTDIISVFHVSIQNHGDYRLDILILRSLASREKYLVFTYSQRVKAYSFLSISVILLLSRMTVSDLRG